MPASASHRSGVVIASSPATAIRAPTTTATAPTTRYQGPSRQSPELNMRAYSHRGPGRCSGEVQVRPPWSSVAFVIVWFTLPVSVARLAGLARTSVDCNCACAYMSLAMSLRDGRVSSACWVHSVGLLRCSLLLQQNNRQCAERGETDDEACRSPSPVLVSIGEQSLRVDYGNRLFGVVLLVEDSYWWRISGSWIRRLSFLVARNVLAFINPFKVGTDVLLAGRLELDLNVTEVGAPLPMPTSRVTRSATAGIPVVKNC
jgi:hypothetical protein